MDEVFIRLENISIRVRDRLILRNTHWDIRTGQHWAVLGPNGAGKTSLVRALAGDVPVVRGRVIRHHAADMSVGYVSFELHRHLIAWDEAQDDARFFSGNLDNLATARQIIFSGNSHRTSLPDEMAKQLEIEHLLDRAIRFLSAGEMRKVLIAKALAKSPRLLILDEPFDGLDINSRNRLADSLDNLMNGEMQVILVTHRAEELLPNISHVLYVEDCKVVAQGKREEAGVQSSVEGVQSFALCAKDKAPPIGSALHSCCLVSMKDLTVRYGDTLVLDKLNWEMRPGENWAITGPNGAGKTTLLRLIAGDHPQAYANEIYLFGKRRGSGESIWEIKRKIGLVSSELQIRYRKRITAFEVVLSGFFDSVGLYRLANSEQRKTAEEWMERLGIRDKSERIFDHLSYGERRMVLLARAVVKTPTLLILDEPCQGLDGGNREMILKLIDFIGKHTKTQILYVSHHPDEMPSCITHTLAL